MTRFEQFTFGQPVENIAASEDNPTKRGFFVRSSGSMVEYASPLGVHHTPADNIRASQSAAPRKWDEGEHEGCGIDSQRALERSSAGSESALADAIKIIRAESCPFKEGPMADGWAEAWATFLNRLEDVDGLNELWANSTPSGHMFECPGCGIDCADPNEQHKPNCPRSLGAAQSVAKPVAWCVLAENGNIRMWSTVNQDVADFAASINATLTPLYTVQPPAASSMTSTPRGACLGDGAPCDHFKCTGNQCLECVDAMKRYDEAMGSMVSSTEGESK